MRPPGQYRGRPQTRLPVIRGGPLVCECLRASSRKTYSTAAAWMMACPGGVWDKGACWPAAAPPHRPQRLYGGLVGHGILEKLDMVIMREEFVEVVAENQRLLKELRKGRAAGRGEQQD